MIFDTIISSATEILTRFIPDKNERAKAAHEIATMSQRHAHEIALAQIEVNKLEAQGNWFQSSWRPLVGWVCAASFAWHFVLQPVIVFGITMSGGTVPALPEFDMASLMTVLGGLLGLGGLRTFERIKGVGK